jgi:hypothetical protein
MEAIDRSVKRIDGKNDQIVFRALMDERDFVTLLFAYKYQPHTPIEKIMRPTMTLIGVDVKDDGTMKFIRPAKFKNWTDGAQHLWQRTMDRLEHAFIVLTTIGVPQDEAKAVLPAAVCHVVEFSGVWEQWEILAATLESACPRVQGFFKPIVKQLKKGSKTNEEK